jgi:poly-gamma-glutamate synthesis protein (capsule biosynthesis protein)
LSAGIRAQVVSAHEWHSGCPVSLAGLRLLRVAYHGFDGRSHQGQLVVNEAAVGSLTKVFRRLYELNCPIRHMAFSDTYGPASDRPANGDVTASFECRQAAASPCTGKARKHLVGHAYGEAVDLNSREPVCGCGMSAWLALSYLDCSRLRRGW